MAKQTYLVLQLSSNDEAEKEKWTLVDRVEARTYKSALEAVVTIPEGIFVAVRDADWRPRKIFNELETKQRIEAV